MATLYFRHGQSDMCVSGSREFRSGDDAPVYRPTESVVQRALQKLCENYGFVRDNLRQAHVGSARGVDEKAIQFFDNHRIPHIIHPAQWSKHGRGAGCIRNKEMLDQSDLLLAIWDGHSRGTEHAIRYACQRGLPVFAYNPFTESMFGGPTAHLTVHSVMDDVRRHCRKRVQHDPCAPRYLFCGHDLVGGRLTCPQCGER